VVHTTDRMALTPEAPRGGAGRWYCRRSWKTLKVKLAEQKTRTPRPARRAFPTSAQRPHSGPSAPPVSPHYKAFAAACPPRGVQ